MTSDALHEVPVTFSPAEAVVRVRPGTTVAEAARATGVLLSAPCAGRGVCGGCAVRVLAGELEPPDEVESRALKHAPDGVRLACRARVVGPVEVRPVFSAEPQVRTPASAESSTYSAGELVAGIDLGTTSVGVLLAEAEGGREVGRASVPNRQSAFGADVLARVSAALAGAADDLQGLAEASIAEAVAAAGGAGGVSPGPIVRATVAANTAMAALLTGADVGSLSAHPFTPPRGMSALPAGSAVRRVLSQDASVTIVPPIAAFVGGDALAAALSAGLIDIEEPTLLVDVGTNAELVLARPDGLFVSSTAAGPAFEGVGVSCGGPAAPGAVERVEVIGADVVLRTISGAAPAWLSGAGVVSAVAALREVGHLTADGALVADGPLAARFARDGGGILGIRLSGESGDEIVLTQLDVRTVQLAKAAVRAGIETLLREARTPATALAEVLVAGAFGAALDPGDLMAIGVLPSNVAGRVRQVGNAALEGATLLALDPSLFQLAERTASNATHVDLAASASFNSAFIVATELGPYEA